jgi:hypothetical protein
MTRPTVLVCGVGRCELALTMHMLRAGGVPCVGPWPAYRVGDRVDFPSRHNRAGNRVRPKHGLRVGRVSDVDDRTGLTTVMLYEDADSVPDPTGPLRGRFDELWHETEPVVCGGPLRDTLGGLWVPGNDGTSIVADFCTPNPIYPHRCFHAARGLSGRRRGCRRWPTCGPTTGHSPAGPRPSRACPGSCRRTGCRGPAGFGPRPKRSPGR